MARTRWLEGFSIAILMVAIGSTVAGYYSWKRRCRRATAELVRVLRSEAETATLANGLRRPGTPMPRFPSSAGQVRRLLAEGAMAQAPDPRLKWDGGPLDVLWYALAARDVESVRLLLEHGADPNGSPVRRPLAYAVEQKNPALVEELLRHRADPNARDDGGETALFTAVERSTPELARLLLAHGAKAQVVDDSGKTPLDWAARCRNEAMARLLRRAGAVR